MAGVGGNRQPGGGRLEHRGVLNRQIEALEAMRREQIRAGSEAAVQKVLDNGLRTADLSGSGRPLGTSEMTNAVIAAIEGA